MTTKRSPAQPWELESRPRRVWPAALAIGIAVGVAVTAIVYELVIIPAQKPVPSQGPSPMMVYTFVNFTGSTKTPDWSGYYCPASWGLPEQTYNCNFSLRYEAGQYSTIAAVTSPDPQTPVGGTVPDLPLNCTSGTICYLTVSITLPPNGPTNVDLSINIRTA